VLKLETNVSRSDNAHRSDFDPAANVQKLSVWWS